MGCDVGKYSLDDIGVKEVDSKSFVPAFSTLTELSFTNYSKILDERDFDSLMQKLGKLSTQKIAELQVALNILGLL